MMIMENKLRIINNLDNISENNNVTLEADLVCDCGNKYFKIYHSGKQTKGIFAPYLILTTLYSQTHLQILIYQLIFTYKLYQKTTKMSINAR